MELSLPMPSRLIRLRGQAAGRPHVLRWLIGGLLAAGLLLAGWLWLRDSSLVSVERVRVAGVHGPQARELEQALTAAARRMTTMDFDTGALRAAVASFPVVEDVRASTGFPHTVRIRVIERSPVAALSAGGVTVAVAADGTVLGQALVSGSLPVVSASLVPLPGKRIADASALAAVTVLGAAPAQLARFVTRAFEGPEGLTLAMRNGLVVYFGDALRPYAKWLSLARVLADPGSAGASYVDVRVPERPAAGHAGAAPVALRATVPAQAAGSEAAAAALAERLASTVGGEAGASTSSSTESGSGSSVGTEQPPAEGASRTSSEGSRAEGLAAEHRSTTVETASRGGIPPASGGAAAPEGERLERH